MSFDPQPDDATPPPTTPPPLPVIATPSPARRIFILFLFFTAVAVHTNRLWAPPLFKAIDTKSPFVTPEASGANLLPLVIQTRMYIGAMTLVEQAGLPKPLADKQRADMEKIGQQLKLLGPDVVKPEEVHALLILYTHFDWPEAAQMQDRLRSEPIPTSPTRMEIDAALRKLYLDQLPLDAGEIAAINSRLGFFAELATLRSYRLNQDSRAEKLQTTINSEAKTFVVRMGIIAAMAILAGVTGVVLLTLFIRKLASGQIRTGMTDSRVPPHLGFEVMTLYLTLLLITPYIITYIAPAAKNIGIVGSVVMIPLIFIIAAIYPLTQRSTQTLRVRWKPLAQDLGFLSGRSIAIESGYGIAGYLGTIPLILLAALISAQLVRFTGQDGSDGVHPIVPLLGRESDNQLVKAMIFLLAVVIAPITEEIIFRGYFYRFLRSRYDTANSIFISAALFSGIHPQGMVGFFPLLAIGIGLAVLREWRGSIIAPIVMHAVLNGMTLVIMTQLL